MAVDRFLCGDGEAEMAGEIARVCVVSKLRSSAGMACSFTMPWESGLASVYPDVLSDEPAAPPAGDAPELELASRW